MYKILFYNKFIICLYMFRALLCSSSGGQNCIIQHLVSSHLKVAVPYTGWEKTTHGTVSYRCDDTRCCIIQCWPPADEHNSARNMYRHIMNLKWNKILCIKLVNYLDGLVEKPRRWPRCNSGAPCSCCGPASSSSPSPVAWPNEPVSRNCHSFSNHGRWR